MKVIDCFTFFNDFDLLEIRLNSLATHVDKFVLVESPVNQRGNPKPLFFNDNKERFKQFNIKHVVTDNFVGKALGETEWHQYEYMIKGVSDNKDNDIILLSAMDEIPNLEIYEIGKEGFFSCQMYYYYLNYRVKETNTWLGTFSIKGKNLTNFQWIRERGHRHFPKFAPTDSSYQCGWHFSVIGSVEQMMNKYDAHGHLETDDPAVRQRVKENRENLHDPWYGVWSNHRRNRPMWIEMPKGPKWLLENKEKYEHLFLKGESNE